MTRITDGDEYRTQGGKTTLAGRMFPTLAFYFKVFGIIVTGGRLAKRGKYTNEAWVRQSVDMLEAMEESGADCRVEGLDALRRLDRPAVFIANHMSMLETVVLPCLIADFRPVTFVVKRSLMKTPWFGHVLESRRPIVLDRDNPREDLVTVLTEGRRRLDGGISVVVFPQSTRSVVLDRAKFNSIGCKLAKRAGAPVVPVAIKSDAWRTGKLLKDFGKFDPSKPVRFAFGEPIEISGAGRKEHEQVYSFIERNLRRFEEEALRRG